MHTKNLNSRQWKTYELIKKNSLEGKITTQIDIINNYPISLYEDGYKLNVSNNTSDLCPEIWRDIEEINFSPRIEKIVIVNKFTYKITESKEESEEYAKKFLINGLRKLKRHWNIINKIKLDGQVKLLSNEGNVIDDNSKARTYFETYLRQGIEQYDEDNRSSKEN